jgi:hypothetical protein
VLLRSLTDLQAIIRSGWSSESCDPVDLQDWSPQNPARGQCAVTALVLQEILGGELLLAEVLNQRLCARMSRGSVRGVGEDGGVPRISAFYGIVIEMYFEDHPPPHFHALYAGDEALIVIDTGEVYAGALTTRALRLVREWLELHRTEMQANWELASQLYPTSAIEPLP